MNVGDIDILRLMKLLQSFPRNGSSEGRSLIVNVNGGAVQWVIPWGDWLHDFRNRSGRMERQNKSTALATLCVEAEWE
jgi:hypothetical protein